MNNTERPYTEDPDCVCPTKGRFVNLLRDDCPVHGKVPAPQSSTDSAETYPTGEAEKPKLLPFDTELKKHMQRSVPAHPDTEAAELTREQEALLSKHLLCLIGDGPLVHVCDEAPAEAAEGKPEKITCPDCEGKGIVAYISPEDVSFHESEECERCLGRGYVRKSGISLREALPNADATPSAKGTAAQPEHTGDSVEAIKRKVFWDNGIYEEVGDIVVSYENMAGAIAAVEALIAQQQTAAVRAFAVRVQAKLREWNPEDGVAEISPTDIDELLTQEKQ